MDPTAVVATAREILSGRLGVVHGCRVMVDLVKGLSRSEQKIFLPFIAVESETEDMPLGDARIGWDENALARKDQEIAAYLEVVRDSIYEACRGVLARYG